MALLPISTGELMARVRRALGVRGSISISADDVMIPVMSLLDATQSPFRNAGLSFMARGARAAVAAQLQSLFLCPDLQSCTIVLDFMYVNNQNAAVEILNFGPQEGQSIAIAAAERGFTGETLGTNSSPPVGNTPLGVQVGTSGVSLIGRQTGRVVIPAGSCLVVPCPFTIQPTQVLVCENDTVNQVIDVTFVGRFYLPSP